MNCLDYFKQLCSVPHGSGNTKQVSDLLFSFCKEHSSECFQDEKGNVAAYKEGSAGRENEEPVILQAHMDMVCVADEGVTVDLSKEPIRLCDDGTYIWAEGTSLGADDGIGVAMIMAVLADGTLSHPPIEAVFTVDEETSMVGAGSFDISKLKGKRMINLDDETEGAITVGCAGGTRFDIVIPCLWEALQPTDVCYKVSISGLLGGHSGCDITEHRANAARLVARIFYGLSLKMGLRLCEFRAGRADNVIPSGAEAVIAVPEESIADFERLAKKHEVLFRKEYPNEAGMTLSVERTARREKGVVIRHSKSMMRFLSSVPDGLRRMCEDFPDTARTSSNCGICTLEQKGMHIRMLLRSSLPEDMDELKDIVLKMAEHDGASLTEEGSYPAWVYRRESPLRSTAIDVFKDMNGKDAAVRVTHGGLETGLFDSKIEDFDCISMGPTITDIHSPREKMEIDSALRTYEWLTAILAKI